MFRLRSFPTVCSLVAAVGAAAAATPAMADLTWNPNYNATTSGSTAADGVSMFGNGKANWTDSTTGLAYTGTISASTAVNKNLFINSGYINAAQASTLGGSLYLGSSGSLTMTGGVLRMVSGNFSTVLNNLSNAGASDATGHPAVNISGGLVLANSVQDVAVTLSGTGELRLAGNSSTANATGDPISFTSTINITSEDAKLAFGRKIVALVVADHINNGEILIDGAPAVVGSDPSVWEPGDNCVITTLGINQFVAAGGLTTVRKQTNYYGSCVTAGACTLTYQASCTGTWTQNGSCAGTCTVSGVCTPVTDSSTCSGTFALAGTCSPALFQPTDASFEGTSLTSTYGNNSTGFSGLAAPATGANNTRVANWWNSDDWASQVMYADGATIPLTIHSGGSNWGRVGLPPNSTSLGGLWTRVGNYDPGHGAYSVSMDVGDRSGSTFTMSVALVCGNITPMDNFTPYELGVTAVTANSALTETTVAWSTSPNASSTAVRSGTVSLTLPIAVGTGLTPQAGDALWLMVFNNTSGNIALFDNVAVLGSCCDVSAGCTMTRPDACASPSSFSQNGTCSPNVCNAPLGGCCVGPTCSAVTLSDCNASSGAWTFNDTSCTVSPCTAPTGTCCIAGNCSISTQGNCTTNNGTWNGASQTCTSDLCPAACCALDGSCTITVQSQCSATWQINSGSCSPANPCPQPLFACCDNATGACTLIFTGTCATGTTVGANTACDANSCPPRKICCGNTDGSCVVMFSSTATCATGSTTGTGTVCSPGTPSASCPVLKICCNTTDGSCVVLYSSSAACATGSATGTGTTCDPNVPSGSCPVTKICCATATGACVLSYSTAACGTGTAAGTGTTCTGNVPSESCPIVKACCNTTTGACTVYFSTASCASGTTQNTSGVCDSAACDSFKGACCEQSTGACTIRFSADCAALLLPDMVTPNAGTYLGNASACPAAVCVGEHEPNSEGFTSHTNNPVTLASGDTMTGVSTGANFDTGLHGYTNGSASNPFVDMWLIKSATAAPGIYRHELNQLQGSTINDWTIRGYNQSGGASTFGGNAKIQGATGTTRTMVWYGFGKEEGMVVEIGGGSSTPYVLQMTDTPVTPTATTGSVAAGPVIIRVVSTGTTVIDSDTWLYDSNFNALTNDATSGPGGADGLFTNTAPDPAGTTSSFIRTLPAGTYYLAVCPGNLANDQPNDPAEGITSSGTIRKFLTPYANGLLCDQMAQTTAYTCHIELTDSASATIASPDLNWPATSWNGVINFVQFTVSNPTATGVCCRGATCSTAFADAAACAAAMDTASPATIISKFVSTSSVCNNPVTVPGTLGNTTNPCCYANYNHNATLEVQDIFDFLNDWFAGKKAAIVGGDGNSGTLAVQNIFDFLNAWFAGGCS